MASTTDTKFLTFVRIIGLLSLISGGLFLCFDKMLAMELFTSVGFICLLIWNTRQILKDCVHKVGQIAVFSIAIVSFLTVLEHFDIKPALSVNIYDKMMLGIYTNSLEEYYSQNGFQLESPV